MEIQTVTQQQVTGTLASEPASAAATQISSDFETFLQMLTAQMQYQDPLNPIDSTDYATQLATFSGVEQAVQTNDLLKALTSQLGVGGLSDMAAWVGKEVRAAAPAMFEGQPIKLYPQSLNTAQSWEISVSNTQGEEVARIPLPPGASSVDWDGTLAGGLLAPDGTYSFTAIGRSDGQIITEAEVETYASVTEARLDAGQQVLILKGDVAVPFDSVTAVRNGG